MNIQLQLIYVAHNTTRRVFYKSTMDDIYYLGRKNGESDLYHTTTEKFSDWFCSDPKAQYITPSQWINDIDRDEINRLKKSSFPQWDILPPFSPR
jgi:hypothetical protein